MKPIHHQRVLRPLTLSLLFAACVVDDDVDDESEANDAAVADYDEFDLAATDEQVEDVARRMIRVTFPGDQVVSDSARTDADELSKRFAHALLTARSPEAFAASTTLAEVIDIRYRGIGRVSNDHDDGQEDRAEIDHRFTMPERYSDGALWLVGWNGETKNEFEVRIPAELATTIGDEGSARGIDRGWPGELEIAMRGLVGPNDTRVLIGTPNTAQGGTNPSRIVSFVMPGAAAGANSVCTGTLVGRHHVVTAAHCMYDRADPGEEKGSWTGRLMRVGRNGTAWHASADASTGNRWFWIEAQYQAAADQGSSPAAWDFGLVITPTRHIGASVGWFGWGVSNTEQDDMVNRGYPGTAPDGVNGGHMFGDTNNCRTGDYSGSVDSQGYSLFGYHSCDTTGGHSGSPLYRQQDDGDWVVRGVHKGAGNPNSDTSLDTNLWNSFALVTRDRADMITHFRAVYP